ncbi:NADH:flavin oxidoreductase/NADH oxidase family protein [Mycolicibacterium neworleansense]|uniref:NADH:flavin oxidoreductase/NADH oxidase n=1 Tax=Mycolicibacterium neworleansense TaxID=146018 RepID=A0A0H5RUV6_9MYCO|nr:NADH:flavin oxidoreductase/NADH oxidase family protein [Mycolicibacterium neworleansense]MCV7360090.1 NADH:flavin oxidoreductase/NADH oxidase family protein [Mycolicibacterium neworleansense]CRZ17307.1 NADH:flavin oxidoreductase/NADH oxidase [Mycolicibacterium neworleansense]
MSHIGQPLTLACGQTLPNRLMKAGLSEQLSDRDHAPTVHLEHLYERWGRSGCGLTITGNVTVDRLHMAEPRNVAIEDDRDRERLSRWATAAKRGGTSIWLQLNHPGRQANPLAGRTRPVAPSAVALAVPGAPRPRALTGREIEATVLRFATAAAVAKECGFDGVQLHGAHGYLISQFLSPLANKRDDDWGGDLQRRMRFPVEVLRAVRAAVGDRFAVGIKLNSADFQRGGFTEDESEKVVACLAGEQIDLIEISGGTFEQPAMMGSIARQSTREREAYFLTYAERVREHAKEVPLAVTGGFRSRSAMEQALAEGACDIVGIGRPLCIDPKAARRLLDNTGHYAASGTPRIGARSLLGRFVDLHAADAFLDVQWHTDQIHRIAKGLEPDPGLPWWRSTITAVRRNGLAAIRRPRRRG